jgi:molybdopterin synthase sulfur carrier subunit
MAVTLSLPTVLAPLAGGQRTLEASGPTLGAVVDDVAGRFPQLAPRLRDEAGNPYRFVTFYLNDQDCRFLGGFDAPVQDGDEVAVVPAIAGG